MVKFSDYINGSTIKGRANVAKATYASIAALYLFYRYRKSRKKSESQSESIESHGGHDNGHGNRHGGGHGHGNGNEGGGHGRGNGHGGDNHKEHYECPRCECLKKHEGDYKIHEADPSHDNGSKSHGHGSHSNNNSSHSHNNGSHSHNHGSNSHVHGKQQHHSDIVVATVDESIIKSSNSKCEPDCNTADVRFVNSTPNEQTYVKSYANDDDLFWW